MGGPSDKPEFPPLLPIGRHPVSLDDLQEHCVDAFPQSSTRQKIMDGLRTIVEKLTNERVPCELWIDGSFLTQKINADDCDLVLCADGDFYDNDASDRQRAVIDWVMGNLKEELRCDSFGFFQYSTSSPNFWVGEYDYCYWMRQWGFTRGNEYKGIGVLMLDGTDPSEQADDAPQGEAQTT